MKKIVYLVIVLLILPNLTFASDPINISEFTSEIKNYSNGIFPELSDDNWILEVISRKYETRWTRYS